DQMERSVTEPLEDAQGQLTAHAELARQLLQQEHRWTARHGEAREDLGHGAPLTDALGDRVLEPLEAVFEQSITFEVSLEFDRAQRDRAVQHRHPVESLPAPQRCPCEIGRVGEAYQVTVIIYHGQVTDPR